MAIRKVREFGESTIRGRVSILPLIVLFGSFVGCSDRSEPDTAPVENQIGPAQDEWTSTTVPEQWVSVADTLWNLDTPAFWQGPDDRNWVLTTGKESHAIHVFDAEDGSALQVIGGPGEGRGQFMRPNGIVVQDDWAFVVERDNHRVQVLDLPTFETVATIGANVLERPYGLVLRRVGDSIELFVTDQYEVEEGAPIPEGYYTRRVKRFELQVRGDSLTEAAVRSFGDADPPGALTKVESIGLDPERDLLLVAEEAELGFKEYRTDGTFAGGMVGEGLIVYEPEGIALYRCGANGYWIMTDQHPDRTLFHVLERVSYRHLGTFTGSVTGNTDGVSLTQLPTREFPSGAFFAVHDDQAVSAFDWRDIATALELRSDCTPAS